MRVAIERKQFDTLIEQYRSHPDSAPNLEVLREVALAFQRNGQRPAARKLFEYVYAQEIAEHRLSAANILGLAEIRLQDGDTRGALQLLRRLALVVGVPFENLEPAASLLSKTGHHAEAVEFLSQLVKATPWDERIRLKLAQEQLAAGVDADSAKNEAVKVASDPQSTYTDREDAASLLRGRAVGSLGSEELNALASGDVRPENSDKPHFYSVRLRAAEGAAQVEVKERLLRNALNDNPAREPARVQLFTLLANSGKSQLAVSTIQPMLNTGFLTISRDERNELVMSNDEEETTPESPETDTGTPVQLVSEMERVKVAEKAKIAYALANSFEAMQEYQKALDYFRTARTLELSKSTKATIDKNIANVRATLRRNATNDQRVPMVHVDLEQENTVRPRLVASAKTPPKSPPGATKAPKGGAQ
jgi:tetratricopeptide (TPR) repeat protein